MDNVSIVRETLEHEGGTYSLIGEDVPPTGYLVGGAGSEHIVGASRFTRDSVQAFINENRDLLYSPGYYLGTWVNDGRVHLDVTEHHTNVFAALQLAAERRELAVWDINSNEEIKVGESNE